MAAWFESTGERGVLEIERRDGSWCVANPPAESRVNCLGTAFGTVTDDQPTRRRIRGTVSSYKRGTGRRADVLFLRDVVAAPDAESGSDPGAEAEAAPGPGPVPGRADGDSPAPSHQRQSSLERIARERIGAQEFRQTDEASLVGDARRRASQQHRAPAIDARLQSGPNDGWERG